MKPGWTTVTLEDIATVNPRGDKLDDAAPVSFVGMAQLDGAAARAVPLETRPFSEVGKGYTQFRNGDLLLAKITPCWENGKIGVASLDRQHGAGSTEFHVVRPKSAVDARYLLHFLRQARVIDTGTMRMTGSGGQRRVPVQFVRDLQVPLPLLEEQRRIARVLDRADFCRVRNEILADRIENLAHSLMRRIDWSEVKELSLSQIADIQGGLQVSTKRANLPREVPYLRVANVYRGHLRLTEVKTLRATDREIERTVLREGDLLFVEGHANPDEVGRVAAWPGSREETVHQNHLIRARLDRARANPTFVSAFLNFSPLSRRHFREHAKTTSGLNTISASVVKSTPVLLPPLSVQNRFSRRIHDISGHRAQVQERSKVLEELFASLQSRAFRGEL